MDEFPSYNDKFKELTNLETGIAASIKLEIIEKMRKPGLEFQHNIPIDTPIEVFNAIKQDLNSKGWIVEWIKDYDQRDNTSCSYLKMYGRTVVKHGAYDWR